MFVSPFIDRDAHIRYGGVCMISITVEGAVFLGWFAVIGGVLNVVGDWALLGFPVAGKEITLELMREKRAGRVRFGAYVGMVAIPMWLGVLFPIAHLLRNAPVVYTIIAAIGLVLFIMSAQTYHVSYVFYDIAYRDGNDGMIAASLAEKKRLQMFSGPPVIVASIALVIGGAIAGAPIWWMVLNPLVTLTVPPVVGRALPAPLGGYILTAGGSLGFAVFGLATLLIV